MIELNERFTLKRDRLCWILLDTTMGKDKAGNPKEHIRQTYHPNFNQIASTIMDRMAGDCESVKDLRVLFNTAVGILTGQMKEKIKPRVIKK